MTARIHPRALSMALLTALLCSASWLAGAAEPTAVEAVADAPPAATTSATASGDPAEHAALYQAALRALADNRPEEAAALLERFLKTEPRHAGAMLDLAITRCEMGDTTGAERLFREIELRFAPPPGILEVITAHRASGCRGSVRRTASWVVTATRGHDNNVNQGASNPTFTIGSGANQVEYELAPDFRPQADNFSQLGLTYMKPLDSDGTRASVQLNGRRNDTFHGQDANSALFALEHDWAPGAWRVHGTAAVGVVTLDKALYQRQQQVQVRVTPPLALPQHTDLALTAAASHVSYPTRPAYGGTTYELGSVLGYHNAGNLVQATLTGLHDRGDATRPGGDRSGWFGSVQWFTQLRTDLNAEAGLTHLGWRSSSAYSPGLIEQVRHQDTTVARVALQWYFRPNWSVVSEWRATRNRENISLFQYNSRAIQFSLRWDNF